MTDINEIEQVLKLGYNNVRLLANELIVCDDYEKSYIFDKYGNELGSGKKEYINTYGDYVIIYDSTNMVHLVISAETRKSIKMPYNIHKVEVLGQYLLFSYYDKFIILNSNLEKFAEVKECYYRYYNNTPIGYTITYQYKLTKYELLINKFKNYIEYYRKEKLNENIEIRATSYNGYTFKYKIYVDDRMINNTEFYGVSLPFEILERGNNKGAAILYNIKNTLFTLGEDNKYGLMDYDGNIILDTVAKNIKCINNDNFIITLKDNSKVIINRYAGVILNNKDIIDIDMHYTLPMCIIKYKDRTECLDIFNRWFNMIDISKYFNCEYCESDTTIIKVKLDYGCKYVTNRLEPITNLHTIAKLSTLKWIPM